MQRTVSFLGALSLSACALLTVVEPSLTPADVQISSTALEPGSGTVTGSALFRLRGGGSMTCHGNAVFLIPATESASSELQRIFGGEQGHVWHGGSVSLGGGTLVIAPEPNRRAICNAQGFFTFANVGAGKWHIMTNVLWTVDGQYQGGALLTTVELADGQETDVVLSY